MRLIKDFQVFQKLRDNSFLTQDKLEEKVEVYGKGFLGFAEISLLRNLEPEDNDLIVGKAVYTEFRPDEEGVSELLPWHLEIHLSAQEAVSPPDCSVLVGLYSYIGVPQVFAPGVFKYELFSKKDKAPGMLFVPNERERVESIRVKFNLASNFRA